MKSTELLEKAKALWAEVEPGFDPIIVRRANWRVMGLQGGKLSAILAIPPTQRNTPPKLVLFQVDYDRHTGQVSIADVEEDRMSRLRHLKELVATASQRPSVESWVCPLCGSPVWLSVSPSWRAVAIFCTRSGVDMHATVTLKAKYSWQTEFISDDWIED